MLAIAAAIEASESVSFGRCAVDARGNRVEFYSPRNSRERGCVSRADALALAQEIRSQLGEPEVACVRNVTHDCACPKCKAKPAHSTRGWTPD